jgi:nicotinamidase/pyrazinamidase
VNGPTARLRQGDAILVVDVQLDFCPGGSLPVDEGDRIVPVLNQWLDAARERGIPVYASRDWHPPGHISFAEQGGRWPPHCVQETPGAGYHPRLDLPDDVVEIRKGVHRDRDQYSAFEQTGLAEQMRERGIRRLWVGGLAQDVCVRASVLDGREQGFEMHLIAAATRPVEAESGLSAILEMKRAGAIIEEE